MFTAPWLSLPHKCSAFNSKQATTAVVGSLHLLDDVLGHGALLAVPQDTVTASTNISL